MPEAVVTVKYVNPPRPGKKHGTIKASVLQWNEESQIGIPKILVDDQVYGIPPAMLGMVKEHGTYKIFYESREFQGKTYHTVKTVNEVMAPPPKTEAVAAGGRHDDRGPKSWVCSLLGHAFAAGKLDPLSLTDIVEAGRIYRDAERLIFSDEPVPEQRANGSTQQPLNSDRPLQSIYKTGPAPGHNDMNDEIPF